MFDTPPSTNEIVPYTEAELQNILDTMILPKPEADIPRWLAGDDFKLLPLSKESGSFEPYLGVNLRYGPHTILIYAEAGEQIVVTQRQQQQSKLDGPTQYRLVGPEQAVISEGTFSLEKPLSVSGGSKGIYVLTIMTRLPRKIDISNRYAVIKAGSPDECLHPFRGGVLYFYVPKRAKEFAFIGKAEEPFELTMWGPYDAQTPVYPTTIHKITSFNECRIKIPQGADGRVWKIRLKGEDCDVFLRGVPPFLANDPSRLLKLIN
jgi:hypothetical protein